MSSFLTCSRGHRWPVAGSAQPDLTQSLVCPVCGLQPETIPPLVLNASTAASADADFSLSPDLSRTDILEPAPSPNGPSTGPPSGPTVPRSDSPVVVTVAPPTHVGGY